MTQDPSRRDLIKVAALAAAAAHEIRNPLGIIRATVDLMLERGGATINARDSAGLQDIVEEVQRLRQLTDDLLELSADKPLSPSAIAVGELLDALACFARKKKPSILIETSSALQQLHGDPLRLRQILQNLVDNALQANASRVRISVARTNGGAVISVEDDGDGVANELRAQLFDPFATGKSTGTGLGLALSRRLAERHRGTLQHVPTERGARFELHLPQPPQ